MPRQYPKGVSIANYQRPKGRKRKFPRDIQSPRFLSNLAAPRERNLKYRVSLTPGFVTNYFSQKYGAQQHTIYAMVESSPIDTSGEFTHFGSERDNWQPVVGKIVEFYMTDWSYQGDCWDCHQDWPEYSGDPIIPISPGQSLTSNYYPFEDQFEPDNAPSHYLATGNRSWFYGDDPLFPPVLTVYRAITNSYGVASFTFEPEPFTYDYNSQELGFTIEANFSFSARVIINNDVIVDADSQMSNAYLFNHEPQIPDYLFQELTEAGKDLDEYEFITGDISKEYCDYPLQYFWSLSAPTSSGPFDSNTHNGSQTGCPNGSGGAVVIVATGIMRFTSDPPAEPPPPEGINISIEELLAVSSRWMPPGLTTPAQDRTFYQKLWLVTVDDSEENGGAGSITGPPTGGIASDWLTGIRSGQVIYRANCPIEIEDVQVFFESQGDLFTNATSPVSGTFDFTDQLPETSEDDRIATISMVNNSGIFLSDDPILFYFDGVEIEIPSPGGPSNDFDFGTKIGQLNGASDEIVTYTLSSGIGQPSPLSFGCSLFTATIRIAEEPPLILDQEYNL